MTKRTICNNATLPGRILVRRLTGIGIDGSGDPPHVTKQQNEEEGNQQQGTLRRHVGLRRGALDTFKVEDSFQSLQQTKRDDYTTDESREKWRVLWPTEGSASLSDRPSERLHWYLWTRCPPDAVSLAPCCCSLLIPMDLNQKKQRNQLFLTTKDLKTQVLVRCKIQAF